MGNLCAAPGTSSVHWRMQNQPQQPQHHEYPVIDKVEPEKIIDSDHRTDTKFSKDFKLYEKLGQGSFGTTYVCKDRRSKLKYACKVISIENIGIEEKQEIAKEVRILHKLRYRTDKVVKIYKVYEDDQNIYIVMELCEGGELLNSIMARRFYQEDEAATIFRKIVEATKVFHDSGVIHRDLKPENIIMKHKTGHEVKIIDFGLSTFYTRGQTFRDIVGTMSYIAPEVLKRKSGPESDVWSIGIILYVMLSGNFPFKGANTDATAKQILSSPLIFRGSSWPRVSNAAKHLISKCLDRDPKKRPTPRQILGHPWLRMFPSGST